jgi:hypothetical protein
MTLLETFPKKELVGAGGFGGKRGGGGGGVKEGGTLRSRLLLGGSHELLELGAGHQAVAVGIGLFELQRY